MKRGRFSEEQIVGILKEHEAGRKISELARENGISEGTLYTWKSKYGGMEVGEAQRLRSLEDEYRRLKQLVADLSLERSIGSTRTKKRLELAGLRADAAFAMEQFALSERRACRLVELERSSYRYEPRADHNAELREELVKLARQKPRYGYRRLHVLLSKRGHPASAQRIYRLYREERLMVRRLRRKRLVRPASEGRLLLRSNQEWAVDFACDALATGRGIRILAIVDAFTRECLTLEVDTSLSSPRVTRALEHSIEERGMPESIRCDNGPELTSRHFLGWCEERKIQLCRAHPRLLRSRKRPPGHFRFCGRGKRKLPL